MRNRRRLMAAGALALALFVAIFSVALWPFSRIPSAFAEELTLSYNTDSYNSSGLSRYPTLTTSTITLGKAGYRIKSAKVVDGRNGSVVQTIKAAEGQTSWSGTVTLNGVEIPISSEERYYIPTYYAWYRYSNVESKWYADITYYDGRYEKVSERRECPTNADAIPDPPRDPDGRWPYPACEDDRLSVFVPVTIPFVNRELNLWAENSVVDPNRVTGDISKDMERFITGPLGTRGRTYDLTDSEKVVVKKDTALQEFSIQYRQVFTEIPAGDTVRDLEAEGARVIVYFAAFYVTLHSYTYFYPYKLVVEYEPVGGASPSPSPTATPKLITGDFDIIPSTIQYRDSFTLRPRGIRVQGCTYKQHQFKFERGGLVGYSNLVRWPTQDLVMTYNDYVNMPVIAAGTHNVYMEIQATCGGQTESVWVGPKLLTVTEPANNRPPFMKIGWFREYDTSAPVPKVVAGTRVDLRVIEDPEGNPPSPSDPDGDPITWTWDFAGSPSAWVRSLPERYGLNVRDEWVYRGLVADTVGTHTIRATVKDKFGASYTATAVLEVIPPNPVPVIDGPSEVVEGRPLPTPFSSARSYSPIGRRIDHSRDEWTNLRDRYKTPGTEIITLHVYDEAGLKSLEPARHTLVVKPDLPPVPVLEFQPTAVRNVDVPFTNRSYSPDGDRIVVNRVTYQYDADNDGNFEEEPILQAPAGQTFQLRFDRVGKYRFRVYVREDWGREASGDFMLNVVNDAPQVSFDTSSTVSEPIVVQSEPLSLNAVAGDPAWASYDEQGNRTPKNWFYYAGSGALQYNGASRGPGANVTVRNIGRFYRYGDYSYWYDLYGDGSVVVHAWDASWGYGVNIYRNGQLALWRNGPGPIVAADPARDRVVVENPSSKAYLLYRLSDFLNLSYLPSPLAACSYVQGGSGCTGEGEAVKEMVLRQKRGIPADRSYLVYAYDKLLNSSPADYRTYRIDEDGRVLGTFALPSDAYFYGGNRLYRIGENKLEQLDPATMQPVWSRYGGSQRVTAAVSNPEGTRVMVFYQENSCSLACNYQYVVDVLDAQGNVLKRGTGYPLFHFSGPRGPLEVVPVRPVAVFGNSHSVQFSQLVGLDFDLNVRWQRNTGGSGLSMNGEGAVLTEGKIYWAKGIGNQSVLNILDLRTGGITEVPLWTHTGSSSVTGASVSFAQDGMLDVTVYLADSVWDWLKVSPINPGSPPVSQLLNANVRLKDLQLTGTIEWYDRYLPSGEMGFGYRMADAKNGYRVVFAPAQVRLQKIVNGQPVVIASSPILLMSGQPAPIKIEAVGTRHKVYVGGVPVIDVEDGTFTGEGMYGPFANRVFSRFQNVAVADLSQAAAAYRVPNTVIVGEPLEYTVQYDDPENDPAIAARNRWMVAQTAQPFLDAGDGYSGRSRHDGQTYTSPVTVFDKVGLFRIAYDTVDDPHPNYRYPSGVFEAYRKKSNTFEQIVVVHRRPVARFTVQVANDGTLIWNDQSYDPDRWLSPAVYSTEKPEYRINRGIYEWKYRYTTPSGITRQGKLQRPPETGTYVLGMAVKDEYGAWSDWYEQTVTVDRVVVNNPPAVTLTFPNGSQSNPTFVATTRPTFTWTQTDPDPDTVFSDFQLIVRDEAGNVFRDTGIKSQNNNSTNNGSWTLDIDAQPGRKYQVQVRVSDGQAWSAWSNVGWFQVNRPPEAYMSFPYGTPSSPTIIATVRPTFSWAQTDPDPGTVFQRFRLQVTDENGNAVWDSGEVNQWTSANSQSYRATVGLPAGKKLRVRVQVFDGYVWSAWSPWAWFRINRAPTADFDWTPAPAYEGDTITLTNRSTDPDGDTLTASWTVTAPDGTILVQASTWDASIAGSLTVNKPGAYTVTLTVRDPQGAAATITKTIAVRALSVTGYVTHTPLWQEKIDRWNRGRDPDDPEYRKPDEFWAGEAFVLRADTTDTGTATVATKVEVTAYGTAIPYWWHGWGIYERLTADNPQKTRWVGKATDRSVQFTGDNNRLQNLQNGYLDFRFRATYSNGVVKEHVVRVYVRNKWTDVYQIHRAL